MARKRAKPAKKIGQSQSPENPEEIENAETVSFVSEISEEWVAIPPWFWVRKRNKIESFSNIL